MSFPKDFVWGATTSAYQIEGSSEADGKGLSVWDMFTRREDWGLENHTGDVACDHYRRHKEDVALMAQIGLNAYRFSISWPRVLPDGDGKVNAAGLDFYDRLTDDLLAAGIQPWVTLFNWDYPYPLYLRGGWLNPNSPTWFARYTQTVVDRLSDRVTHWMTINEPQCFIGVGHGSGEHAPGLRLDLSEVLTAGHHALLAHGLAVAAIRERAKSPPLIGWSPSSLIYYPATSSPEDIEAACAATRGIWPGNTWNNRWWSDPVILGGYPEDGLRAYGAAAPRVCAGDFEIIRQPLDFYCCNIFQGEPIKAGPDGSPVHAALPPGHPRTLYHWNQTPEALYWGPRFLSELYRLPIVITKNGMSNCDTVGHDGQAHDPVRIEFMISHLLQLHRALSEGVDVRGYFHWSLLDNFTWQEGYRHRFGLVHVDFTTQQRIPKDSAYWYRDLIASNGSVLERYAPAGTPAPPYVVREALRYITAHVGDPFNIKSLAARLRCHPDVLSRKFKEHTGENLSTYIRRTRIEYAGELLKQPNASIDDVAERSGFADRVHFTKVFRLITGQPPAEFQRQFRSRPTGITKPLSLLKPKNAYLAPP